MASPAPALKGVLSPGKWLDDEAATQCKSCKETFSTFNRRHHCRGCGQLYCANCTTMSPLGQYGFTSAVMACLRCAAPYIAKGDPYVIPTAGTEVAFTVYNAGTDVSDLRMEFDGKVIELASNALTTTRDGGAVIKAAMPPGRGTKHSVVIRRLQRGAVGKDGNQSISHLTRVQARISYAKPKISRTSTLKTDGGELTLYGDNFGDSADAIRVLINGVAVAPADMTLKAPHSKVRVVAPPGTGLVQLRLEVGDQADSLDILHAAPEIAALDPPDVDVSGGTIVLSGQNFGDTPSKVQVLLPDLGLSATAVRITEPHVRLECALPALPQGGTAAPGDEIRIRVVVDGIHSLGTATVVYCPPYGVPAQAGKPAYFPKRPISTAAAAAAAAAGGTPSKGPGGAGGAGSGSASALNGVSPAALRASAAAGGANAFSPYADLFSTTLSVEAAARRRASERLSVNGGAAAAKAAAAGSDADGRGGGGLGSPHAASDSAEAGAAFSTGSSGTPGDSSPMKGNAMLRSRLASVRVGGSLAGGGPTLAITPPKLWAPDSPSCDVCSSEFSLTKRRHHCRICGCCVCSSCSPHSLQLASTKPAVRVCTRCHLRVGLLNQMTSVVDAIYNIRKVLPANMYETFKTEVMEAVLAPVAASGTGPTSTSAASNRSLLSPQSPGGKALSGPAAAAAAASPQTPT